MSLPPADVPAKDLWAKLNERPRPHKIVDFPRYDDNGQSVGQVAVWVLTQEEQIAANAEAERFSRKLLKDSKRGDIGYEAIFDNEGAVQVIYRACRNVDDLKKPAFPSPNAIREQLTADEVGMLFDHYMSTQLMFGPTIAHLDDDEFEAWVRRLNEGQAFFFDRLSSAMRTTLALFMARQLVTFWTDRSSAGSPPDAEDSDRQREPSSSKPNE